VSRRKTRCAIYTRKSHAEGLDQAFNSLDAQRQAGVDYVKSQKHEGWKIVRTRYDDGGFSGGTMQRPGLQRLLDDIEHGGVDVVVVYKVDRLSRSLGDFAQMMQRFDEYGVSFVSVTQQFNTTNSMGRLTLNMLLSFAQFEREITGERIRDKIAASKKKGMWVCGLPPLGYRVSSEGEERKLHVVPEEADLVRTAYREFAKTPSIIQIADLLNEAGHTTKRYTSKEGYTRGGRPFSSPFLRRLLTNETYLGRITYEEDGERKAWDGLHDAIIDEQLWTSVQARFKSSNRQNRHRWNQAYLLKGKLRTGDDFTMSPGSVHRPPLKRDGKNGKKRLVRYYISQKALKYGYAKCSIKSVNTAHLDDLIRALLLDHLASLGFDRLEKETSESRDHWIRKILDGVVLSPKRIRTRLDRDMIEECRTREWPEATEDTSPAIPTCPYEPEVEERGHLTTLSLSIQIKRLDGKRMILSPAGRDLVLPANPEPREHIVNAIGLAYRWHDSLLKSGGTLTELARAEGITAPRIRRLLPLTHLGPAILKRTLVGDLPPSITLNDLLSAAQQLDWEKQARELGLVEMPRGKGRRRSGEAAV